MVRVCQSLPAVECLRIYIDLHRTSHQNGWLFEADTDLEPVIKDGFLYSRYGTDVDLDSEVGECGVQDLDILTISFKRIILNEVDKM